MSSTSSIQNDAVRSIVQQWSGGERRLAGARASELVYGKSNKADEGLLQRLSDEAPGIHEFIVAPSAVPVQHVPDDGSENNDKYVGASNLSNGRAKDEQDRIDDALADGREARTKAGNSDVLGSTELNPAGSDKAPKGSTAAPRSMEAASAPAKGPSKASPRQTGKTSKAKT